MKNIEINIGNACNNACQFCMIEDEDSRAFVNFETIKQEIFLAKKQGFESIGFLGGEFTLHPQLMRILKLAKLLGFKIIHIISNGRTYSNLDFLQQIVEAGANRFSVSIHSHLPAVEDTLTQRPGGFLEKIAGLKNLLALQQQGIIKQSICLNFVINALNYQELIASLRYFYDLGVRDFRLNFVWLFGRAQKYPQLVLSYAQFLPELDKVIAFSQTTGANISFEGIPACLVKNPDKLKYLGELKDLPTEVVAYNNTLGQRDNFNWQERKKNEFKIKHQACSACQWYNICDGVWKSYIDHFGWSEFKF